MRLRTALIAASALACVATAASTKSVAPAAQHRATAHKAVAHKAAPKHRAPAGGGVSVVMDEARVVTFSHPVSTVFIGNPMIADATVIDPHHAFVLGKTFGVTNLIALNPQNQLVSNQQITVANRNSGAVTLNKGPNQFNYSCTLGHCETSPRPGDERTFFETTEGAIGTHQDQSLKAASAATTR
ncbi:MAG TPA: pilus assembly protein N-terminal domain-containing protein [Rhizomicrobium sp.]|jgi:hypothetical protein|nr:pilus assembly protein N-terminal domain-containing protein [Rhizomicrobium sp.]